MPAARRLAGIALLAALAPALPAVASQERTPVVLSVTPAFRVAALPAGVDVQTRLPRVGAVVVTAPRSALDDLARTPGVRGFRPDYELRPTGASTSGSTGVLAPTQVGGAAGSAGAGAGVTVAVLDTGVADSPGLNRDGRLWRGPDFSKDSSGDVRDGYGHGTFMANLVAGGLIDGKQVGVAPAATVVDVKVAARDGSTSLSRVLKGLEWVAGKADRIDAVSMSLGAPLPTDSYGSDPLTDGAEAVQRAGVVVVVASGNDWRGVTDPGQDPWLMTIGAADLSGTPKVADFSGRAIVSGLERPDVVAPGMHLLSVLPEGSALATANPSPRNGSLALGTGTSQATAVAAGAVAVFLSGRRGLDPQSTRASFAAAAKDLKTFGDGAGLLVIPSKVTAPPAGWGSGGSSDSYTSPTPQSTSWSSTSWSASSWGSTSWSASSWGSTSWSASSWGSTSWSSTSWSSTSWSSTSWSSTSWSSTSWSSTSWSACDWS